MTDKICAYEGCNERVNSPHDDELCVFHAPKDKKGIPDEEFNRLIVEKLDKGNFKFRGYVFPIAINFGDRKFGEYTNFSDCEFNGDVNFTRSSFTKLVDFENSVFKRRAFFTKIRFHGGVNFINVRFERLTDFAEAVFQNTTIFEVTNFFKDVNFSKAIFENYTNFDESVFKGKANFTRSQFHYTAGFASVKFEDLADFGESVFKNTAYFTESRFKNKVIFSDTIFNNIAYFNKTTFKDATDFMVTQFHNKALFTDIKVYRDMRFSFLYIGDKCEFYFHNPEFLSNNISIIFENVRFNPFAAHFENINADNTNKPIFVFRYCQLKDVYFTSSNMSLFSFYTSSFVKAQYISCEWGMEKDRILKIFKYDRKNIIPEENLLKKLTENINDKNEIHKEKPRYEIKDIDNYKDISSLYRQMKTALDNSKDYQQAGWFYFNELEMKRRALEDEIENSKPKRKMFQRQPAIWLYQQFRKVFSKYILYFGYKVLAGYGEKPLWSFLWFGLFTAVFTVINFLSGLRVGIDEVNYNLTFSYKGFANFLRCEFWGDIANALMFTLYRVIPISYLPFERSQLSPIGLSGLAWSFVNSIVLIILVIFIGIGLKRHFRRF